MLPAGSALVVASHNRGKLREIEALLAPLGFKTVGAEELNLPEPEETGTTFAANAILKAEAAAARAQCPALADDSGLCVDALNGDPGIYSARWAGPEKDFRAAGLRIEALLAGNPDRRAHFVCALALTVPGQATRVFEGRVHGSLAFPPRGEKGFGYDPIFIAEGQRQTFGEMDPAAKHAISHRARAFEKFLAALQA